MRRQLALVAVSMLIGPSMASASALLGAHAPSLAADSGFALVHHKPGHMGGPPWARRGYDRDDWREERRYRREPAYTRTCRTEYRVQFDPYAGGYVRQPVRICREGYQYD